MSILVIRHGETDSNARRILQVPETPLSARGIAQAERLGARLAAEGVTAILSSDYARAHMTAERIAAATGAPIELESTLRERNFGDLRGRSYEDVGKTHGDIFQDGFAPPGGETWEDFHARADQSWARVIQRAATLVGNVAVVTHGLVCRSYALRQLAMPEEEEQAQAGPIGNTSLTIVDKTPPHRVLRFNCCAHLDEATAHDGKTVPGF